MMSIDQLTDAALALRPEERAVLAARIMESFDVPTSGVSPAWLDAAERRRDEVLSDKVKTVDAREVSERVRRHLL